MFSRWLRSPTDGFSTGRSCRCAVTGHSGRYEVPVPDSGRRAGISSGRFHSCNLALRPRAFRHRQKAVPEPRVKTQTLPVLCDSAEHGCGKRRARLRTMPQATVRNAQTGRLNRQSSAIDVSTQPGPIGEAAGSAPWFNRIFVLAYRKPSEGTECPVLISLTLRVQCDQQTLSLL